MTNKLPYIPFYHDPATCVYCKSHALEVEKRKQSYTGYRPVTVSALYEYTLKLPVSNDPRVNADRAVVLKACVDYLAYLARKREAERLGGSQI